MSENLNQPIIHQEPYQNNSKSYSNKLLSQQNQTCQQTRFKQSHFPKQNNSQQKQKSQQPVKISDSQTFYQVLDTVDSYDLLLQQMNNLYTQGMMTIANVKFVNPYSSLSTKGFKPTPAITKVEVDVNKLNRGSQFKKQDNRIQDKEILKQQNQTHLNNQSNSCPNHLFTLKTLTSQKDIKFTYSVIQSINNQYNQRSDLHNNSDEQLQHQLQQPVSQSAHSSQSTANNLFSFEQQQQIIQQQQTSQQCKNLIEQLQKQSSQSSNPQISTNKQLHYTNNVQQVIKQQFILNRFNIQSQKPMVVKAMKEFDMLLKKLLVIAKEKIKIERRFRGMQQKGSINNGNNGNQNNKNKN